MVIENFEWILSFFWDRYFGNTHQKNLSLIRVSNRRGLSQVWSISCKKFWTALYHASGCPKSIWLVPYQNCWVLASPGFFNSKMIHTWKYSSELVHLARVWSLKNQNLSSKSFRSLPQLRSHWGWLGWQSAGGELLQPGSRDLDWCIFWDLLGYKFYISWPCDKAFTQLLPLWPMSDRSAWPKWGSLRAPLDLYHNGLSIDAQPI